MPAFGSKQFLADSVVARLTDTRVADPDFPMRVAASRHRRERLTHDGRLNILAADHPARLVTKVGDDLLAMTDRADYLGRVLRVLISDRVDGVMATMDILEDLLSIDGFVRDAGGPGLLDHKLLIASLNRGGLAGSAWELDDPITGPRPETCQAWNLDGVKILLRIADSDRDSLKTMQAAAQAITESNALGLPVFLEPLPVIRGDKGWTVVKSRQALARIVGVASALGDSSRHLWLKLPYCEEFEAVARAATMPILLLGGESAGDASTFLNEVAFALAAARNVRGALAGRNVLYPGAEDPLAVAEAIGGIVHDRWTVAQAQESFSASRAREMDALSRHLGFALEEVRL
jgi:DhnA family fructose-bisphosphate aldolase class Ia